MEKNTVTPNQTNHIPLAAFQVSKTIYAKKKSYDFKKDDFVKVIRNEIEYHLSRYPELQYKSLDKPTINHDSSMTYIIHFERKEP